MATSTSLKPVKLGEFLKEEQEPFVLEDYLTEKRLQRNNSARKSLKRSCSSDSNKIRRKSNSHCPKVLRGVYNKLTSINLRLVIRKPDNGEGKFGVPTTAQVAESDNFSTASSSTVFNSCSASDEEETPTSLREDHTLCTAETSQPKKPYSGKQDVIGKKLLWGCNSMQLSPVSVLAEGSFHGASPHHHNKPAKKDFSTKKQDNSSKTKITEEAILSASIWKFFIHSEQQKPSCKGVQSSSSSQLLKSKKVLQPKRQLLFDCVREIIKTHVSKMQGRHKQYLGYEELGKLICDKIKLWEKLSADETNLLQLLDFEFQGSAQEWSNFEQQRRYIGLKIADAIFEETKNEIVVEIVDFLDKNTY
ncbi:uncharacterized protein LOC120008994 isoform X1 [Tripterygium wilfordii]|uniref:uncharacterized protein LOC120008994 isoform X1 n=2 Tax=Tripterygium wilfordii TaxID=458696 RepID=UPI0018F82CCF|nr:uncharacterized protein LOC120008994 isoform X1 [Tripterygium wilfordii]